MEYSTLDIQFSDKILGELDKSLLEKVEKTGKQAKAIFMNELAYQSFLRAVLIRFGTYIALKNTAQYRGVPIYLKDDTIEYIKG